ncbi:MAG: hypothetical protein NT018_13360 [Armatimonadetes bacterium]|nr:hypothetical protein [Armatimonadota bacterium]
MFRIVKVVQLFGMIVLLLMLSASIALSLVNVVPTVGTVSPSSGNIQIGLWTTITCTYSDANGAGDLWRCSFLINNKIANTGGAHFAYSKLSNKFLMKNNAGVETAAILKGTATTIETENASLDCAGTSVTAVGNTVTIVWRFKLKAPMSGKLCNLYLMATDISGGATAWVSKGHAFVNTMPTVGTVTPNSGTIAGGQWTTVSCTYSDANGVGDLWRCSLLINNKIANTGGAHFAYSKLSNKFLMKNNAGVETAAILNGTATTIETENASLDCAGTSVTALGNTITIVWRFKLKAPMSGKLCNLYLMATDNHGGSCPWTSKGTMLVNTTPAVISTSPSTGDVPADVVTTFTSTYADADGAANIATCNLLMNSSIKNSGAAHFVYNENTGKLYMRNNAGTLIPSLGVTVGQAQTIESENATLYCEYTTVSKVGTSLIVNWCIKLKPIMLGKVCNLYMMVTDDFGAQMAWISKGTVTVAAATVTDNIAAGKACLNQIVTMEPYDAAAAAALLTAAKSYFLKAKNLETNNAQANFGLAITDAAVTAQGLIDKYQAQFADTSSASASLKYAVGAMQIMNLQNMADPGKEPLGGLVTAYKDSAVNLFSGPSAAQLIAMQADIRDVVRPMLSRVGGYLDIVETSGGSSFTFPIGPSTWDGYTIVDRGDVYLFHGGLLAARWALAMPSSYSANSGTFNFDTSPMVLDVNHNGFLTPSEWMPPSPFLTLTSSATMTGAKIDMTTAADKIIAGINATLAETSDNHDLIPWHTPGEGPTLAELNQIKSFANSLKLSMNAATVISWTDDDGPQSLRVYLGAWNTNPPADLKTLIPTQEIVRWRNEWGYDYGTMDAENGYPDITFGGMFPDGAPFIEYGTKDTVETGFSGTLVGITTNPADLAANVSPEVTQTGNLWISFSGYPPAVVSMQLQRYYAGAWRNVAVYSGWLDGYNRYHLSVEGSLWPSNSYRIIVTDEDAHVSHTHTFTTGLDAPF